MRHDCFGDIGRDGVFEPQDVGELFVELAGPGGGAVVYIEQLNRDADALAGLANPAFEDKSDIEFSAGGQRIRVGTVTEHAAGGPDGKPLNRAESRNQCVSQTCA
jgi:hypothetical protein